jgi:hypothetical protein
MQILLLPTQTQPSGVQVIDDPSRLSLMLQSLGFHPSNGDTSLFFSKNHDVTMYVLVYVHDIIVASSSE